VAQSLEDIFKFLRIEYFYNRNSREQSLDEMTGYRMYGDPDKIQDVESAGNDIQWRHEAGFGAHMSLCSWKLLAECY
jgi:hypothetical protein